MAITTQVVSVGTAGVTLVPPTIDAQDAWVENLQPAMDMTEMSRDGYAYAVSRYQTIANNGTAIFSFTTGETGAQFGFWSFTADNSSILASLVEGATITSTGTAIAGYNLNRNESDAYDAVLEGATAMTGGSVVLSEFVPASNQAGGGETSAKVITLRPSTEYGFKFVNVGGNGTSVHIQIGWTEKYDRYNDVWLNGTAGSAVRLRGGEKVQFELRQSEGLTATAIRDGVQVAVMRQD
jgi:hypothetical protein